MTNAGRRYFFWLSFLLFPVIVLTFEKEPSAWIGVQCVGIIRGQGHSSIFYFFSSIFSLQTGYLAENPRINLYDNYVWFQKLLIKKKVDKKNFSWFYRKIQKNNNKKSNIIKNN